MAKVTIKGKMTTSGSFKPCFKWLLPKIENLCICMEFVPNVLNLVLNGYSLKFRTTDPYFIYDVVKGFKPCFKWLLPKISTKNRSSSSNSPVFEF